MFLCGLGIDLLTQVRLITGQTAGLAVIVSYLTGYSFGTVFFLINLPFYLIAYRWLGLAFTLKLLISVTLLSLITDLLPLGFRIEALDPALGAVIFTVALFFSGLGRGLFAAGGAGAEPGDHVQPPPRPLYRDLSLRPPRGPGRGQRA